MRWAARNLLTGSLALLASCGVVGTGVPPASGTPMDEPTFRGERARAVLREMRDTPGAKDWLPLELVSTPRQGLPVLRWLLEQGDWEVAVGAARGLARLGTQARVAIPQLALLSGAAAPPHRREFLVAIGSISAGTSEELVAIVAALASEDSATVLDALAATEALAWDGGAIVENVAPLLAHPDASIRLAAAQTLSYSGAYADRAVPELVGALAASSSGEPFRAVGRFGAEAHAALPFLKTLFKRGEARWTAIELAGLIGDDSLRPQLERKMREGVRIEPVAAATALARIGDRSEDVRRALENGLDGGGATDSVHRSFNGINAAAGLYLFEGPERAVPVLIDALGHSPDRAAVELGRIGPPAAPARTALGVLAVDPRRMGVRQARWALRRIRGIRED